MNSVNSVGSVKRGATSDVLVLLQTWLILERNFDFLQGCHPSSSLQLVQQGSRCPERQNVIF